MEDKRIVDIVSSLDIMKRRLSRSAMVGGGIGLFCCIYPFFGQQSSPVKILFWTLGIAAFFAAGLVLNSANRCIHLMTKVMRYYTETTKI